MTFRKALASAILSFPVTLCKAYQLKKLAALGTDIPCLACLIKGIAETAPGTLLGGMFARSQSSFRGNTTVLKCMTSINSSKKAQQLPYPTLFKTLK